jgi:hypothetical protein
MALRKAPFTLFLAPWQIRMAGDFLRFKKITRVTLRPGVIICPASYKIPPEGLSRRDWVLYLTDEQLTIVKERLGLKTLISGINVTPQLIKNGAITFA